MLTIGFWVKETGNLMSHGEGLLQHQIDALKELKPGDRLILWKNEVGSTSNYTFKVYKKLGLPKLEQLARQATSHNPTPLGQSGQETATNG